MINGFPGRINESVHISKHVALNVQQRQVVAIHTNACFYLNTLLFTKSVCDQFWFLFGLNFNSLSERKHTWEI